MPCPLKKYIGYCGLNFVTLSCPNFVILGLRTLQMLYRQAPRIMDHHLKAETMPKLTVHSQLLHNNFSPAKFFNLVNDEVRQGVRSQGTLPYTIYIISLRHVQIGCQGIQYSNYWKIVEMLKTHIFSACFRNSKRFNVHISSKRPVYHKKI